MIYLGTTKINWLDNHTCNTLACEFGVCFFSFVVLIGSEIIHAARWLVNFELVSIVSVICETKILNAMLWEARC
jgi:hypothetical protein